MEDVLELYAEDYDAEYPVVCFDEQPVQLVDEIRTPLPAEPGRLERYDYEYRRKGTANIFMMVQPLAGWRCVSVTNRRSWSRPYPKPDLRVRCTRIVVMNDGTIQADDQYVACPPDDAGS